MNTYAILFDLDGTIADWRHRVHLRPGNMEAFYDAVPNDPLISAGAVTYNLLCNQSAMIAKLVEGKEVELDVPVIDILTCRPERMRSATVGWMKRHGLMLPRNLHMRSNNDDRPHHEIKLDMYRQFYEGEEVLCLFEDNYLTIEAFEGIGVSCFQMREGLNK